MAKAMVYVDGFNLYYGCLKGTSYRWLDLGAFAQKMLPRDEVVGIKYFTAKVDVRPDHPNARNKQRAYVRALRTLPNLSIYYGRFLTTQITARRVRPPRVGKPYTQVWKTEEKGSDVNLATELLVDGFQNAYELAVVVSNDGDLKTPVEYVRHKLERPVGVLNPSSNRSFALSPPKLPRGSFYKPIRAGALGSSQFPDQMKDAGGGTISKPKGW